MGFVTTYPGNNSIKSPLLTGKFLSDPTEGRFGSYRQVHGGNFYMSIHQVIQAEKKIHCLSLLQEQALFLLSSSNLMTHDCFALRNETGVAVSTIDFSGLIDVLSTISLYLDDRSEQGWINGDLGSDWGNCPPKTYESNFIHHDFVQFKKQHLRLKAILSSTVLSQQCCEVYFISLTVAKPL